MWQGSAGPERANAHQKPKMAATEIEKGASKNRKKSEKNKKMSFEEFKYEEVIKEMMADIEPWLASRNRGALHRTTTHARTLVAVG